MALLTDQFIFLKLPFGLLEWVILANGLINVGAFFAFFTLIKLAGPVFASQAGYLVTIFGVIWGMVIFNEVHSGWVWSSLVVMLFGLSLVLPKNMLVNLQIHYSIGVKTSGKKRKIKAI